MNCRATLKAKQPSLWECPMPDLWRLSRHPRCWVSCRRPNAISLDALGFLSVTVVPADLQGLLPSGEDRFAAEYKATSEPILLTSTLIQMGDLAISKKSLTGAVRVDTVPTCTLKLHLYRDEWQGDWQEFQQRLVAILQTHFLALATCKFGIIVVSVEVAQGCWTSSS